MASLRFEIIQPPPGPPPDLLDTAGVMRLLPAAKFDQIDPQTLRVWCHQHGRYGLPTMELVAWLGDYIGTRSAIEIGSGAGDLAWHLKLRATDSRIQEQADVRAYYRAMDQPVIHYPPWVERLDALDAIARYRPQVVIGSWITQWIDPAVGNGTGSMYGVKEDRLLETGVIYILIGALSVHAQKTILRQSHRQLVLPFLRSRVVDQTENRIFIWNEPSS